MERSEEELRYSLVSPEVPTYTLGVPQSGGSLVSGGAHNNILIASEQFVNVSMTHMRSAAQAVSLWVS